MGTMRSFFSPSSVSRVITVVASEPVPRDDCCSRIACAIAMSHPAAVAPVADASRSWRMPTSCRVSPSRNDCVAPGADRASSTCSTLSLSHQNSVQQCAAIWVRSCRSVCLICDQVCGRSSNAALACKVRPAFCAMADSTLRAVSFAYCQTCSPVIACRSASWASTTRTGGSLVPQRCSIAVMRPANNNSSPTRNRTAACNSTGGSSALAGCTPRCMFRAAGIPSECVTSASLSAADREGYFAPSISISGRDATKGRSGDGGITTLPAASLPDADPCAESLAHARRLLERITCLGRSVGALAKGAAIRRLGGEPPRTSARTSACA